MKKTNKGWPEPNDWVQFLKNKLVETDKKYQMCINIKKGVSGDNELSHPDNPDATPEEKQLALIAHSIGHLLDALKKLPIFRDNDGLIHLRDLASELHRLDEGGKSKLLVPRKVGKLTHKDPLSRRIVKKEAVLCMEVLEIVGVSEREASDITAKAFNNAGFSGRKGGDLSSKTLIEWKLTCGPSGTDTEIYKHIKGKIEDWKCSPNWPPSKADAIRWVKHHPLSKELKTLI